ncbi:MAG: low specificity L-threonine aldolase [Lachnospiraceae bacterium]|nr:low specificity L-threonine aldolase [Lachnospiraceae bacterium]
MMNTKLEFASDYMKGAHPNIIRRLTETNLLATSGYGSDAFTASAKDKIKRACKCEMAEVEFLMGGTQTNAVMIDALLRPYQGVVAAVSGHISAHEAGAIEAGGHKVLTVEHVDGKITADNLRLYLENFYRDENHEHMVMPGMVYLSQPTEYGTLYSLKELTDIRGICDQYRIPLYVDGARLAYALATPLNDVTLPDLARLCDAFYIGGTKCGALFGEAVVVPDPDLTPHLFTLIKQHGALLAKGRMLGLQFDELFTDDLYLKIGVCAVKETDRIRNALSERGFTLCFDSPTNQIFCMMEDRKLDKFGKHVTYSFWEKTDESHTVIRLATDWAANEKETDALIDLLDKLKE